MSHLRKIKLFRISTVPISLNVLLKGQLKFISNYFDITAVSGAGKDLDEVAERENVKTHAIEMERQISPVKDLVSLVKLYFYFKKEKPFIVHTHTPKAGMVGMIAAKLSGVPNRLHTVAGLPLLEISGKKRKLLDLVEKITYSCSTKVYPNSYGLKEIIIQNKYCKPEKVLVLANGSSNGIDTDYFNPELFSEQQKQSLKKELRISENDFVFVFVGRLVKDKGINELVSAFSKLQTPNSKLLLVGDFEPELDPLSPKTLQQIQSNPNIISVGFKKDVRLFFCISDALVFPSYREGFPNVVMQAGAMGLPSIVSDINGCNEIIIENKNGIIISVKDENAIQKAIEKLITDEGCYQNLKKNSRPMITSRYEQKVVWNALLEEYNQLL